MTSASSPPSPPSPPVSVWPWSSDGSPPIGVMLLMFGVGLHFSLADLMAVKKIAIPGAVVQIAVTIWLGEAVALVQSHVAQAAVLVVAMPDAVDVRKMVQIARTLNPGIAVVLRTHNEEEADLLRKESWARSSWANTNWRAA